MRDLERALLSVGVSLLSALLLVFYFYCCARLGMFRSKVPSVTASFLPDNPPRYSRLDVQESKIRAMTRLSPATRVGIEANVASTSSAASEFGKLRTLPPNSSRLHRLADAKLRSEHPEQVRQRLSERRRAHEASSRMVARPMLKLEELVAANEARLAALRLARQRVQAGDVTSAHMMTTSTGLGSDHNSGGYVSHADGATSLSNSHIESLARISSLHERRTKIEQDLRALSLL